MKPFFIFVFLFVPAIIFQQNCSQPKIKFNEVPEQVEVLRSETIPDESSPEEAQEIPETDPVTGPVQLKSCAPGSSQDTRGPLVSGTGRMYFEPMLDGLYCNRVQFRSCHDGVLGGSYTGTSCSIVYKVTMSSYVGCNSPIGNIEHGASVMLFNQSVGDECSAQIRTCSDGVLSGDIAYNKVYCRLSAAAAEGASCQMTWNGSPVVVAHNSRLLGFLSDRASTDTGGGCNLSTARCNNGSLVGNSVVVSSCREKRIEEMPEGSLMTGHAFSSNRVSVGYKLSTQSAGTTCSLEYLKNGSWLSIPNVDSSFSCSGAAAGTVIKTMIDLDKIPSFNWTATITPSGVAEYKTKIRLKFNSNSAVGLRDIICLKRGADVANATPELDENCDGLF